MIRQAPGPNNPGLTFRTSRTRVFSGNTKSGTVADGGPQPEPGGGDGAAGRQIRVVAVDLRVRAVLDHLRKHGVDRLEERLVLRVDGEAVPLTGVDGLHDLEGGAPLLPETRQALRAGRGLAEPLSPALDRLIPVTGDARVAASRLRSAGIPDSQIRVTQGSGQSYSGTVDTSDTTYRDQHKGFWDSLGDFFFPEEDRYAYAEGLARGSHMVTVTGFESSMYDTVVDILDDEGSSLRPLAAIAGDNTAKPLPIDRLGQKVGCAEREALVLFIQDREHHHRDVGKLGIGLEIFEHAPAVEAWHQHIEGDQHWSEVAGEREALGTVPGGDHLETLAAKEAPHQVAHRLLVVNDQNTASGGGGGPCGRYRAFVRSRRPGRGARRNADREP